MDERFDVVVVGAGLAGLAAGATAAGAGVSTLILDGHPAGGRASTERAARHPIKGRDRLARFLANIGKRYEAAKATIEPVALNGELGIVISLHGQREAAINFQVEDGLVREVHIIAADDKLAALDRPVDIL